LLQHVDYSLKIPPLLIQSPACCAGGLQFLHPDEALYPHRRIRRMFLERLHCIDTEHWRYPTESALSSKTFLNSL
jgi:hypothetical protein